MITVERHHRRVRPYPGRGSTLYLCTLSATDPLAKYPTLPVLVFAGYEPTRRRARIDQTNSGYEVMNLA
jgi:hypothetical protein